MNRFYGDESPVLYNKDLTGFRRSSKKELAGCRERHPASANYENVSGLLLPRHEKDQADRSQQQQPHGS